MEASHSPDRQTPIVEAAILGRAVLLTYYNTHVYRYAEPFHDLSHIHYQDRISNVRRFYHEDLMEHLERENYPTTWLPWPDQDVEDAFVRVTTRDLGNEYRQLVEGEM